MRSPKNAISEPAPALIEKQCVAARIGSENFFAGCSRRRASAFGCGVFKEPAALRCPI